VTFLDAPIPKTKTKTSPKKKFRDSLSSLGNLPVAIGKATISTTKLVVTGGKGRHLMPKSSAIEPSGRLMKLKMGRERRKSGGDEKYDKSAFLR
tara:strand:- start:135 stop:416 length:282 start_codon:yes stop_codon:yes gene_type:complete